MLWNGVSSVYGSFIWIEYKSKPRHTCAHIWITACRASSCGKRTSLCIFMHVENIYYLFHFVFKNKVLPSSPGCPGTLYIARMSSNSWSTRLRLISANIPSLRQWVCCYDWSWVETNTNLFFDLVCAGFDISNKYIKKHKLNYAHPLLWMALQ